MQNSLETIFRILPHRYPFLMVDRICSVETHEIKTIKNVSLNEPHFQGHFPDNPVMPGVMILEAMFQTGGLYIGLHMDEVMDGATTLVATVDKVKFRKIVVPGDQLTLIVRPGTQLGVTSQFTGKAYVGSNLIAEARWVSTMIYAT